MWTSFEPLHWTTLGLSIKVYRDDDVRLGLLKELATMDYPGYKSSNVLNRKP